MATPSFLSETEQVMGPVIAEMPQRAEQRSAQRFSLGSLPTSDEVKRTTWFIFVLLILLLLAIFVVGIPGQRLLQDPDLYWHTATGRLIWTTGSLPQVDEFSHTFRGHPWIARDWISDLAFYGSYSLDGWRGVSMLAAVSIALAYALLFLILVRLPMYYDLADNEVDEIARCVMAFYDRRANGRAGAIAAGRPRRAASEGLRRRTRKALS